jgi:hypothetical protein
MKTANMTVQQILASNNNGQGKTNLIAESSNIIGEVITFGGKDYTVRQELQSAKLLQYFSRETNPAEVLETLAAGYLGKLHQKTLESGEDKKPAEQVKRLLTADEYLNNCLKLAVIDPVKLYADLTKYNDKSTKAELLTFVETLRDSIVTPEQHETFLVMLDKEENLNALKDLGFKDFRKFVGSTGAETIKAAISLDDWKISKAKLEEGFKFLVAIPSKKDEFEIPVEFDVTFREFTDAEKTK